MESKFGVIVVPLNWENFHEDDCMHECGISFLHYVGYENCPSVSDIDALYDEFSTDKELGLTDVIDICEIVEAPADLVKRMNELIAIAE